MASDRECGYTALSRGSGLRLLAVVALLGLTVAVPARAQSGNGSDRTPDPAAKTSDAAAPQEAGTASGIDAGNYHLQSSVEAGWRYSNFTGNLANYDTFVNLHEGPRLLNFSFNARSLNHQGLLFDSLSLNGFGFGGDPDSVARLRMAKNRWYELDALFRRDKYFWDYNLLANPLNPAGAYPPFTINYSPHALDLSRRMTDVQLTLLPQSRVRVRLGYDHELLQGPSLSTVHEGTEAQLFQNWKNTTDLYHAGFDFLFLPRTTLSYDQYVEHFKGDTSWADVPLVLFGQNNSFGFQLANGVPVDLGISPGPCAAPVVNPSTTPPTANPLCSAYLSYTRNGRPRITIPTERFSFQSSYVPNLTMTGHISYSDADNTMADYAELFAGYIARTADRTATTTGLAKAKRVQVQGDWTAVYQVTGKFSILDTLNYNSFRLPGQFGFAAVQLFAQAPQGGLSGMLLPPAQFNSSTCPPPYTAPTCPQHNASSGPDVALGSNLRYLGQDVRSNTFQLQYDFSSHFGARVGYRYLKRRIFDYNAVFYTAEIFYPGGRVGTVTGPATAARGDCALPPNGTFPQSLPAGCTLQPDGSVVFTGFTPDSDTAHSLAADINGHSALFGFWLRPAGNFRLSADVELFSADHAFTRITPRQLRHYTVHSSYTPVHWAQLDGSVNLIESSDNVLEVQGREHNRTYGFSAVLTPHSRFSFDLAYTYGDIFTQSLVCFAASGALSGLPTGFGTNTCVLTDPDGNPSPVPIAALTVYQSKSHFASADMMVQPLRQVTFTLGYAGSFVRGTTAYVSPSTLLTTNFLYANTPWGPLRFNYHQPYVIMTVSVYKGLSYIAGWNYYGYNSRGYADPLTLTPLGTQDFNGNTMTLSVRYAF